MNILRELRKFKTKSAITKIRILVLLAILLITSAYAWFFIHPVANISNIKAKVVEWDVEYSVDDSTIQEQNITIPIEEFYPGVGEIEKNIMIKNATETPTDITYTLISVRLFGEEILEELQNNGNIIEAGFTKNIFATEEYPFNASYTYNTDRLTGKFVDETSTPDSFAKLSIFASWDYEREGMTKNLVENDKLDTYFGEEAYDYYKNSELSEQYKPLEITIKIHSSREGYGESEDGNVDDGDTPEGENPEGGNPDNGNGGNEVPDVPAEEDPI